MRPDDLLDEFELDPAPIWPAEDGRLEPIFLAEQLADDFADLAELDEASTQDAAEMPPPLDLDDFPELDPDWDFDELNEPPLAPRQRASTSSILGSIRS